MVESGDRLDSLRPDGDCPPSTLFLLVCDDESPQPVEVFARLEREGFHPEECELPWGPGPSFKGAVWQTSVQIARDSYYSIACLLREDHFRPWEWSDARWSSIDEFEQARAAKWVIALETYLRPENPTQSYHLQLQVAAACSSGLSVACYDENSTLLRSTLTLDQLAQCPVPPAPTELFQTHVEVMGSRAWIHTHGLRRFDLPELELFRLRADDVQEGRTAIRWLSSYLLGEHLPSLGGIVEFGDGISTELRSLEQVFDRHPLIEASGPEDRDESHLGWRCVLLDPEIWEMNAQSVEPRRLLSRLRRDPVFWLSQTESARRARLARERFALAAMAFFSQRYREIDFLVKVAMPASLDLERRDEILRSADHDERASCEHMWFEVKRIDRHIITGELTNSPIFASYLKKNETYKFNYKLVSHFEITIDGYTYSPENITELDLVALRTSWKLEFLQSTKLT